MTYFGLAFPLYEKMSRLRTGILAHKFGVGPDDFTNKILLMLTNIDIDTDLDIDIFIFI